jgi:hypothetical protein
MRRRQVFALATALTLTVLTGAFALLGFAHRNPSGTATPAALKTVAAQAVPVATPERWDD